MAAMHSSGVRVATLTNYPFTVAVDPQWVVDALNEARSAVDVIVVDLHPSYSDLNLAILTAADRILVPVTPDLPAIRAAVQLRELAEQLGIRDRLALVVNRANSGVSLEDIETATDLLAVSQIRSAGMLFVKAANLGKTLVEQFGRERVTADFEQLAERVIELAGVPTPHLEPIRERTPRSLATLLGRKSAVSA
jgi:pilus assembly protein CpaE